MRLRLRKEAASLTRLHFNLTRPLKTPVHADDSPCLPVCRYPGVELHYSIIRCGWWQVVLLVAAFVISMPWTAASFSACENAL